MSLLAMIQKTDSVQWLEESFKSATVNTNVDYPAKEAIIIIIIPFFLSLLHLCYLVTICINGYC